MLTGGFAEGSAHNADKLRLHTKGAATFTYAIDHRFDNTRYRQLMCHCHVAW
ncbi:Uncharacterised protein [Shigella sonnei]|nr:Uncharacterised protein [Shigella sonnei]